jgi:hypothetical protein
MVSKPFVDKIIKNKNYRACNFVTAYHDKNAVHDSIIEKNKNHKKKQFFGYDDVACYPRHIKLKLHISMS